MQEKKCTKCGETKPMDAFVKQAKNKDGRHSNCRLCNLAYRIANKEKQKQYYQANREQNTERSRQYRAQNRERVAAYNQQYRAQNQESILLNRIKKREHKSEYRKLYYLENRERIRENSKRYRSLPHVKLAIKSQKLKRRTLASKGDVTASFLEHLFASQTSCAYCNRPFCQELKPTIDHVFPVSKGGTHTKDNIVLACQPCNRRKSDKIICAPPSI